MFFPYYPVGMTLPATCLHCPPSFCCAALGGLWLCLLPVTRPILHLLCSSSAVKPMQPEFTWTSSNFSKESVFRYNHFKLTWGKGDLKATIAAGRQDCLCKQDRTTEIQDPYQEWLIPELFVKLPHAHFRARSSPGQGTCGPWEPEQSWPELCRRSD